jgi:hypothetical protein
MARLTDADLFAGENTAEERRNLQPTGLTKYTSQDFPTVNTKDPLIQQMMVRNQVRMHEHVQQHYPELLEQGRQWYPKVNEAVEKGIRGHGLTHLQGSGMVAALSPSMDFDKRNIAAFDELLGSKRRGVSGLTGAQWQAVHKSAAQPKVFSVEKGRFAAAPRTPEAEDALRGKSVFTQTDENIVKAHRMMEGEPLESVMPRQTAPKTHSFAWDIHDPTGLLHPRTHPGIKGEYVTVDGRQFDIATNRRIPWNYSGRGISSADLPKSYAPQFTASGKQAARYGALTKYEDVEKATHAAAQLTGEQPMNLQAINWLGGKELEKSRPTKSGAARQKGETRMGQPYFSDVPGAPVGGQAAGRLHEFLRGGGAQ